MYARVVRFSGVTPEGVANVVARIEEGEGPPPGVESTAMKLLHDEKQGTSLFVAFFESEEKMAAAAEVLSAMDAGDTPGTRASVDHCEVVIERDA